MTKTLRVNRKNYVDKERDDKFLAGTLMLLPLSFLAHGKDK